MIFQCCMVEWQKSLLRPYVSVCTILIVSGDIIKSSSSLTNFYLLLSFNYPPIINLIIYWLKLSFSSSTIYINIHYFHPTFFFQTFAFFRAREGSMSFRHAPRALIPTYSDIKLLLIPPSSLPHYLCIGSPTDSLNIIHKVVASGPLSISLYLLPLMLLPPFY